MNWRIAHVALGGVVLAATLACGRASTGPADSPLAAAGGTISRESGRASSVPIGSVGGYAARSGEEIRLPTTVSATADFGRLARIEGGRVLGVPTESVNLASVEAVRWSDSSLGCPGRGRAYTEMVIPGYRAVVSVAGRQHRMHGDTAGRLVFCAGIKS